MPDESALDISRHVKSESHVEQEAAESEPTGGAGRVSGIVSKLPSMPRPHLSRPHMPHLPVPHLPRRGAKHAAQSATEDESSTLDEASTPPDSPADSQDPPLAPSSPLRAVASPANGHAKDREYLTIVRP